MHRTRPYWGLIMAILHPTAPLHWWCFQEPLRGLWPKILPAGRDFGYLLGSHSYSLPFLLWIPILHDHWHQIHVVFISLLASLLYCLCLIVAGCCCWWRCRYYIWFFAHCIRGLNFSFVDLLLLLLRHYLLLLCPRRCLIQRLFTSHQKRLLYELLHRFIFHLVRTETDIYQVIQVSILDDIDNLSRIKFVRQKLRGSVRCIAGLVRHHQHFAVIRIESL